MPAYVYGLNQGTTTRWLSNFDDHIACQYMLIVLTSKNKREKEKWRGIKFQQQSVIHPLPVDVDYSEAQGGENGY